MSLLQQRKSEHLDLCAHTEVGFKKKTALFECVRFIHDALPDLSLSEIDTSITLFGKRLKAPLFISAMTGGTPTAKRINLCLAEVAEELGIGFGLGSQRAMLDDPKLTGSFDVRNVAPNTILLGNLSVVQATKLGLSEIEKLVHPIQIDALCIHLNPAMEVVQSEGDRDFRGSLKTIERLIRGLSVPVIVKETGCGISDVVGRRLREIGVFHVDVSGAGGTSWVAVETERAKNLKDTFHRNLGESLWDWGIPTAASILYLAPLRFKTMIATGGIQSGTDVAKAIALGADAAGLARPILKAFMNVGENQKLTREQREKIGYKNVKTLLTQIVAELKAVMLLTNSKRIHDLKHANKRIFGELLTWT